MLPRRRCGLRRCSISPRCNRCNRRVTHGYSAVLFANIVCDRAGPQVESQIKPRAQFLVFVGGISIPPDYARTRSQSRQVKRRVVIDQPSRTKYYTGCPVLHCGHVPYLEWLSTAPSKTNLVFAIRLAQQALPSRSARASPREVYAAPRRPQDPPLRPPQRC